MPRSKKQELLLSRLYYDTDGPASYGGVQRLYDEAKQHLPNITLEQVKYWLSTQNTYTLHKQARRRWKREKIIASHINEQFQADLVEMQEYHNENDGMRYILTAIDVFSKYAFAVPIRKKTGEEVREALEKIFLVRKPQKLQTDQGREFDNNIVKSFLKENGVVFFTARNDQIKCAIVERFNRSLKSRMFRYFTRHGTRKYIDKLQDLVDGYNRQYHRSIGMSPINVTPKREKQVFKNLYGYPSRRAMLIDHMRKREKKPVLKQDDLVRRKYKLKPMDKSYHPLWTDEMFRIKGTSGMQLPLYKIATWDNDPIDRRLYKQEIQKVDAAYHRVEKILDRRVHRGRVEYLIKWLNYPSTYNSWEPATNVINL